MAKQDDLNIDAPKITKPMQLLGALLIGLVSVNGSFLAAAGMINSIIWIPALLCIAAVINVPLFLVAVLLLLTRFRAEMQEDRYYFELSTRKAELAVAVGPIERGSYDDISYAIEATIRMLLAQKKIPSTSNVARSLARSYSKRSVIDAIRAMTDDGYLVADDDTIDEKTTLYLKRRE